MNLPNQELNYIKRTELSAGASTPFSLLHISDNHLTLADSRDGQKKISLAEKRFHGFPHAEDELASASKYAREHGCIITHTGDLIDFVSYANLDRARKFTDENDCIMTAGNHEFSLYVGEAKEDENYRNISLERVQRSFKNNIRFSSRLVNGVNIIALDNSYYRIDLWQLVRLKEEINKAFPAILMLHTPLYNEEIYNFAVKGNHDEPAYLMCVPEEKMSGYSPERYEQQKEDTVTREAYRYISESRKIKAILSGHLHHDFETELFGSIPQFVAGIGSAREIIIR